MSGWWELLALVIGALVGYSYGLIAAVLALLGLLLGGVAGFHIAAAISLGSSGWSLLGALLGAMFGASLLGRVGHRARAHNPIPGLGFVDGILGAVLGAGLGLVILWLLSPAFTIVSHAIPLRQAAGSGALARVEQALGITSTPGARGTGRPPGPAGRAVLTRP